MWAGYARTDPDDPRRDGPDGLGSWHQAGYYVGELRWRGCYGEYAPIVLSGTFSEGGVCHVSRAGRAHRFTPKTYSWA